MFKDYNQYSNSFEENSNYNTSVGNFIKIQ